jgi:hypothetical protein
MLENKLSSEYWKRLYHILHEKKLKKYLDNLYRLEDNLEEKIPKIRQKIFGDQEFLELSKRLVSYNPQTKDKNIKRVYSFKDFSLKMSTSRLEKMYDIPDLKHLIRFHFAKTFSVFTNLLTNYLNSQRFHFDSFTIMVCNEYTNSYIPYFFYRLDEYFKHNFYINLNDEIFSIKEDYEVIKVTSELTNNPFFKKRISNEILKNLQFIYLFRDTIVDVDFLYVFFFKNGLEEFLANEEYKKIHTILRNTYFLFKREDNILFEHNQKILKRMVFSYTYYQVKKLLCKFGEIMVYNIYLDKEINDFDILNQNIEAIKNIFKNQHNFLLIRNHINQISIVFKNDEKLKKECDDIFMQFESLLNIEFKVFSKSYNIKSWSYLEI